MQSVTQERPGARRWPGPRPFAIRDCAAGPYCTREVAQRRALPPEQSVIRLAVESWLDGCLCEGRAAAQAAAAAERASDAETRGVLRQIAADEQRHAELAWAILAWALDTGADEARDAVHALREPPCVEATADQAPSALEAHGRLGAGALNAAARAHHSASRSRVAAFL